MRDYSDCLWVLVDHIILITPNFALIINDSEQFYAQNLQLTVFSTFSLWCFLDG